MCLSSTTHYGKNNGLAGFYDEVARVFTQNLTWKIGRNLNAFNDILRGGFGINEYGEPFILVWENIEKSKADFGYPETAKYLRTNLESCHPNSSQHLKKCLIRAENGEGETIFVEIINVKDHEEIEFISDLENFNSSQSN